MEILADEIRFFVSEGHEISDYWSQSGSAASDPAPPLIS
jgi:hypothetical protein